MTPPLVGFEDGGSSPTTAESKLKEQNYFGLPDSSSVESSNVSTKVNLNFKATELRLGLPGSQSPERDPELSLLSSNEKTLFPLTPVAVSGSKRGFSDTIGRFNSSGLDSNASLNGGVNAMLNARPGPKSGETQLPQKAIAAPAAKAQVVGWPPIRSFRKNTLATTSKNTDPLFVKVSMDGAPYLRKVDLRSYSTYQELSSGLEKMFSCFTLGQCGVAGRENMSESKLKDLLHGSEYVVSYEDKDGDWMLVGDVPWEMFTDSCKRLKIMKGSDAIGLAPRAVEKSKSRY